LAPRRQSSDAGLEAARLHDLMLDRGDEEGRLVWVLIRRAIEALHAVPPTGHTEAVSTRPRPEKNSERRENQGAAKQAAR
jgi:hypothetical protein